MNKESKIRRSVKWKTSVQITRKVRSKSGFDITGPDGKTYHAATKFEALNNLHVRVCCFPQQTWKIVPTPQ